jgi:hypothetical protein
MLFLMRHSLVEMLSSGEEFVHEARVADFILGLFCFP